VAIDLEDAVATERKVEARSAVAAALTEFAGTRTYVRVNHPATGLTEGDIDAIVHPNLDGIVLPKVEDEATIRAADGWLSAAERARGITDGHTSMLVLIESALGLHNAAGILQASGRVETAIFGYVDFMVDVGIDLVDTSPNAEELLYARSAVVVAARIARRRAPLDGPFLDITDHDQFRRQCRQGRSLGFAGKMLIHPAQIGLVHEAFRPSPAEAQAAARIVRAFESAEARGDAAIVVDGRLVDYPVAVRARRILEAAS
jgi:citrate lyase subunit beta / citryl-CoA lyase